MIFVGIDPDLHCTAWGTWIDGGPQDVGVIETKKKKGVVEQAAVLEMASMLSKCLIKCIPYGVIAVEAQTLHVTGLRQHKRPQDIVTLGNIAGAVLGILFTNNQLQSQILFPTAMEWKGQIPKAVMQARFYTELGWGYKIIGKCKKYPSGEYAVPLRTGVPGFQLKQSDWKHCADALMLAKWASENWQIVKQK